jgi:hypothetical protein
MYLLEIRHKFENLIIEMNGSVSGGGSLLVKPFTTDFQFELEGREYIVNITPILSPEEEADYEEEVEDNEN